MADEQNQHLVDALNRLSERLETVQPPEPPESVLGLLDKFLAARTAGEDALGDVKDMNMKAIAGSCSVMEMMIGARALDSYGRDRHHYDIAQTALNQRIVDGNAHAKQLDTGVAKVERVADDRTWNVDEVARLVTNSPVFQDAVAAAVARGVNDAMAARAGS